MHALDGERLRQIHLGDAVADLLSGDDQVMRNLVEAVVAEFVQAGELGDVIAVRSRGQPNYRRTRDDQLVVGDQLGEIDLGSDIGQRDVALAPIETGASAVAARMLARVIGVPSVLTKLPTSVSDELPSRASSGHRRT